MLNLYLSHQNVLTNKPVSEKKVPENFVIRQNTQAEDFRLLGISVK